LIVALSVRIKPRAQREMERAAAWWAENRPAAPGAVRKDAEAALALLAQEPGIGTRVEAPRPEVVRRLFLPRVRYFLYYRVRGGVLEVVAFWHASREEGPSL
jgi:plasmid stabilization system protein ParE